MHNALSIQTRAEARESPLRILHVVPSYFPAVRYGGPIRTVQGLATASAARGHDVHVYTTSIDGPVDLERADGPVVRRDRVSAHYFPVTALRRLCWSPAMGAELKRTIGDFDVVHLHSIYLWPTLAAARAAKRAGVPFVVSLHGMLVRDLIRRKSRWTKTAWIRLVESRTLADAGAVHVTADREAAEAEAFGVDPAKIVKIRHGVDWASSHSPLSQGPFSQLRRPYALSLSRINWKKGLDRLIESWKRVPELQLVIAGNDEESYTAQLVAMARAAGIAERVHFIGPVQDEDKWALYENADMFVLPSYNENFGVVVAAAMAMRCPVIITPEVGISEIVQDAGAGLIVSGEPAQFAGAVRRLLADVPGRREMGRRGRRLVTETLSWNAAAADNEALYRDIIRSGAA